MSWVRSLVRARAIRLAGALFVAGVAAALMLAAVAEAANPPPTFRDVTAQAGIDLRRPKLKKYGAPSVVDLDRDGWPDLLFCHHDQTFEELYFNNRDGTFSKAQWGIWHDTHGLNAWPVSPTTRTMRFSMSVGGNFGLDPNAPFVFEVNPVTRAVTRVDAEAGLDEFGGRGRSAIYLDLSQGRHPQFLDIIYTNAFSLDGKSQFAYEGVDGKTFKPRQLTGGFEVSDNSLAMVTDVDNDDKVEIVAMWRFTMYKVTGDFALTDITNQVYPSNLPRTGVIAVAELDFDNDGDFDLYVARTRVGPWLPDVAYDDFLLENRNGKYVDVSERAGIPKDTQSHGVTTGDFNNDGWMDVYVSQYVEPDFMLLNKGDGTFERVDGLTTRPNNVRGDNAVGVDYDLDGTVDLVSSQGDHNDADLGGSYRIFKNVLDMSEGTANFINVRVGVPWDRSCTPMHAVVLVNAGNLWIKRRVGSPGTEVSNSYLETLHFGLGSRTEVTAIYVKYANGYVVMRRNVMHGQTVLLGLL
ncbi:unnamed protein product [Agarophyton chilense]